jgi:hypothetical protein
VAEQPCCQFTKTEMRSISAWRKSTGSASVHVQRNEDEFVEGRLQAAKQYIVEKCIKMLMFNQ